MAITYLSDMSIDGTLTLTVNADADSTYTGIVVSESGLLKYRTKAQIKADIGAGDGTVTSSGSSAGYIAKFSSATNITNSGIFQSATGIYIDSSDTAPVYIRRAGVNDFAFVCESTSNTSNLRITPGTESTPGLNFGMRSGTGAQDTNTGIYSSAADNLEISTGGSTALSINTTQDVRTYAKLGIRVDGDAIPWRGTAQIPAVINLAGNGALFTRPDNTFLSQNFYYDSSDAGAVIDAGKASIIQLSAGDTSISTTTSGAGSGSTVSVKELVNIASDGEIKIGNGTTNAGFLDFDGTSLQLNTQRNPNTGGFVDAAKSNASINLVGADGGSYIRFNTANANNTTATERVRIEEDGDVKITEDLYGKSVNAAYSSLYKFGGLYFTWDSDSYGTNFEHSITSTTNGTFSDAITINSYGNLRLNFDSNNNDSGVFSVGYHTTGTANTRFQIADSLSTFNTTVLIDGVLNYTGLEVKGSGASRPSIQWSNTTQGDLGSIFGTEANALVLTSGSGNLTTLTLDSSNNATFEQNVSLKPTKKLYLDGGGSTYIYESSDGVIDFIGDGVDLVSMKQNGTQSEVVVNESSGDVDFRVESNNNTHALFVEANAAGRVGILTNSPASALDVDGTVRVRNQLNVGETTEQNLFVAGGSLTDGGERYAKFGYYGEAELLTPGGTSSSQLADTKRTTAAFGTSGKLLEDLQYVVVKVEPGGWVNRYGDPSSNQSAILAVESYGVNTVLVLDHVTVWKSYDQGGGSNWTQGDYGGIPGYQIVQYEAEAAQRGGGGLVSVAWTYPAALANYTGSFAYTRPAYVGQGTTTPANQAFAIVNNKRALGNRGLYIQTYENYTSARKNANHYIRLAYRVFRRGVDFVDATALTITGGGGSGPGPGGTLTSFTRTTSTEVFNTVCSSASGSATAYHNGSGTYPAAGDNVYTNSNGSSFLAAGYYKIAANNSFIRITGGSGEVSAAESC